jgi:hypothetical protein
MNLLTNKKQLAVVMAKLFNNLNVVGKSVNPQTFYKHLVNTKTKNLTNHKRSYAIGVSPKIIPKVGNFGKKFKKLFYLYLYFSGHMYVSSFKIHYSHITFYLVNFKGGLSTLNIHKYFLLWNVVCLCLYNLCYYKLKYIVFGTHIFKNEILALNWFLGKSLYLIGPKLNTIST